MKKWSLSFLSTILSIATLFSQTVIGDPEFEQGQELEIIMDVKTTIAQQAMGQSIDFAVNATGTHTYKVTNTTPENTTLHHKVNRIQFSFDGMGRKNTFDSEIEKDIKGPFGASIKEIMSKEYDMIIDSNGMVLMAIPQQFVIANTDQRMALLNNLLKEVLDIVQPPAKGSGSFFRVLPAKSLSTGDTWTESWETSSGTFNFAYALAALSDSTILIDFAGSSVTVSKAEMMGSETTTTMNNKLSGKIILDKKTKLILEKTINQEGTGNTETSFGILPVTSKTTTLIKVKKL